MEQSLEQGSDITIMFVEENNLLHKIAMSGFNRGLELVVKFALERGLRPPKDEEKSLPQAALARERKLTLKNWINQFTRGQEKFTPLHLATFHGNLTMIRFLIKHGADLNQQNPSKLSLIHLSAQGDQPVSMIYFLEKGAAIDQPDSNGRTPLHHAAIFGCEVMTCYLVQFGAYINAKDSSGNTPMHTAITHY